MTRKENVVGVFGRAAPTYDQVGPRPFAHFGRRLVELADIQPFDEVLDVASGRGAAGFDSIAFAEESHDLVFADADEWWRWVWSHGQRGYIEDLDDEQLERHRADVFARLPDPIVNTWTVLLVFARRP